MKSKHEFKCPECLTLVDFYSFYFRNINPKSLFRLSYNDEITGGMFNFIRSYFKVLREFNNVVLVIDKNARRTRQRIDKSYKTNRDKRQMEVAKQGIDIWQWKDEFLQSVPYYSLEYEGKEADDIIATIVKQVKEGILPFAKVSIISLDTDLLQLVDNKKVFFIDLKDKWSIYTNGKLLDKFGLTDFRNILYYKVFFGDKSDNIEPSVIKGLRKKKLIQWLNEKGFDYISSLDVYEIQEEVNKLYGKEVIDIERFAQNIILIDLTKINIKDLDFISLLNVSYGNEDLYNNIIHKYNFKAVPSFKDIHKQFKQQNKMLDIMIANNNENQIDDLL